jgi:hypothetical protein
VPKPLPSASAIPTVIGGNGLRLQTLPLPHLRQALAPLVAA